MNDLGLTIPKFARLKAMPTSLERGHDRRRVISDEDAQAMRTMHAAGKVAKQVWAAFPHVSLPSVYRIIGVKTNVGDVA